MMVINNKKRSTYFREVQIEDTDRNEVERHVGRVENVELRAESTDRNEMERQC